MRDRIGTDAAHALKLGIRFGRGNTTVIGPCLYLCGHQIVHKNADGTVSLTMAGYPTKLTQRRLNSVCEVLGLNARFYQRANKQFVKIREKELEIGLRDTIVIRPDGSYAVH